MPKKIIFFLLLILITSKGYTQSIETSDFLINEKITSPIAIKDLKSLIKIDSIVKVPDAMYMSTSDALVYIGRTYFEYYDFTGLCHINVINFDDKILSVSFGKWQLSRETSVKDILLKFKMSEDHVAPIDIYQDSRKLTYLAIQAKQRGKVYDGSILFIFFKNKLTRIDFWEPS